MVGKRLVNTGGAAAGGAGAFDPLQNFETVTYTGNGGTQKITGYIRKGAAFNGSSSGITLPKSILDDGALKTFSISLWFQTSSTSEQMLVSTSASSSNAGINLNLQSNGYLIFQMSDGSGNSGYMQHQTDMSDGDWHHVVVTYSSAGGSNDATTSFYLDGTDITSSVASGNSWSQGSGSTFSSISYLALGRWPASSYYYLNGKLDQVRFFNKVLSSSEATTLYGETYASSTKSTTDIFSDGSGVALYQLDDSANDTGGVSGKFGSAAIFNGSNADIDLPSGMQSSTMTVSLWMYLNATETGSIVYEFSNGYGLHFLSGQSGKVSAQYANSNNAHILSNSAISTGQWVHIVGVHTSSSSKLYVNGTLQSGGSAADYFTCDQNTIGSRRSGEFFEGKLDDIRIYSDELTSTEVGYIYNNTTASIPTDNLQAYYKLDGDATDETTNYDGSDLNVTYAYDGTATNVNYLGMAFQPDLVWVKKRSSATDSDHLLNDSVRGVNKILYPNLPNTEDTAGGVGSAYFNSFDSNGFTVGSSTYYNGSGETYVAWCWKAADTTTTIAAGTVGNTIASDVRANQDAGFSIVKYGGNNASSATIGHGLSSPPELIITKARNFGAGWPTMAKTSSGYIYGLRLNESGANDVASGGIFYNNTAPTNSVYTVGGSDETNDGYNYIAYCFHSVDGYQKIGSYTGNRPTTVSVATGFQPRFVMIKCNASGESWTVVDSARGDKLLHPDTSGADQSYTGVSFTSTGFQVHDTGLANTNGATHIYLAIA